MTAPRSTITALGGRSQPRFAAVATFLAILLSSLVSPKVVGDESSRTLRYWYPVGSQVPIASLPDQLPPPPALRPYFDAFLPLYLSYNAVPASMKKPNFSQWLIVHGVVDPTTHQAMMLLYVWAERLSRPLV